METGKRDLVKMITQGDETDDEEYFDDPIKLIDFEQKRVNTLKKLRKNCHTAGLTDSGVDVVSDSIPPSNYQRVSFTLPASFFTISQNVALLNGCRPVAVKVVDCIKHRSYYKKNIRSTDTESDIIIVDDNINESVENVCESDIEDCVVISDSEKEESLDEAMGKPKIRPVDITSYIRNNKININNSAQRTSETLKPNEKREKEESILENEKRIDFKKNTGLVGLRIVQRANVDDGSKRLVVQKIVDRVNVDKTKDCSNVEKEKSSKVDSKTSQSSKPVHHDVSTLKVSSKSKLLESKSTEKSVKKPESKLSTSNVKNSITNKESLSPKNTNSSKVYKETEKPSNLPEEINLTSKHDKHKSSTDKSEKRKNNLEPSKTKKNKEKECISKYFKDVWDKDLRLALEQDTIRLKNRNSNLKYFIDKLKIDKRKNRKENTKHVSNPAKIDTDNDGKANNNKSIKKLKKARKDREKSKKKNSIVSDNTKKDSTHNKSMPSLLLGEHTATDESQIEGNVSSKSTIKKSEKLNKIKSMGVEEKSDVQQYSNQKNRNIVINEEPETSCKDNGKLVINQLATKNKLDKKTERNKNNSETANLGSSTVNYNLNRDVIDKDKPMSTSTGNNRNNPGVMHKDKTSTSIPIVINKQLQADKPVTSKTSAIQQIINQNNSHPLNQKQNDDLYNEDRRKSQSLAKYLFYLQKFNPNSVGGDHIKHAVKPQECILSFVNSNQQVPKDPKTHTVIGDTQKSSNSLGNNSNSQQIPNQPSNKRIIPSSQTMPNNSTNDCNKPDAVKKSNKTFNMTNSVQDLPHNASSAIEPMNAQQIPNQPNKALVPPAQTMLSSSTNDCIKPDAVNKSKTTFDDNNVYMTSSMQDLPQCTSSAIRPMNSQQIPNQPSNNGLVPPAPTMPNNSRNDCNKPDAVKKSKKTLDDNNVNMTSSMPDLPQNTSSVTAPMNSQQITNQPSNKGLVPPAPTMQYNSTNDCNKPDAVKKSKKTLDDNNVNMTISMPDLPHNTSSAIGLMNSQQIPNQPSNKGLVPPAQTMPHNSRNDCNKPDAVKKSNKTFHDNMTNSSVQDVLPNSNLVKEIDTATSIKSEVSIKKDPSESSNVSPINPDQQTASQRIIEEYGEPIQAFVTNRNDYHKDKLGIAPQVNMKNSGNLNTFPHGVIHCAPIYHGAPQNMPQGDQNQFGFYHPPQGKHISHAQPPMSLPVPQMSQHLPQMSQTSQLSPQISQPPRQMPQPSRQMPQPLSQSLPQIFQHPQQMSQHSQQIQQHSRQMTPVPRQMQQPSQKIPQPSQQMPQPVSQMSQHSPQISQPSRQMPQPSRQMPQPSRQMLQPSRQMPLYSQQMPQPSRQMPQPSRQIPQPSQQMLQSSQQISRPPPQMSHPSPQMWHSAPQISPQFGHSIPQMSHNVQPPLWYPLPQMPNRSSQIYHPELQQSHSQLRMSQPQQQMSNCDLRMSYPQTQNSCLCEKCHIGFQQTSNLPAQMMHSPSRMLNMHQEVPHFLQCLSNPSPAIRHPLPTSLHTQEQTWNTSQHLSNSQSQISHLPQQMSNPPPQMSSPPPQMSNPLPQMSNSPPQISNPPVKYDNVAQSVSGSTIIGRNNDGVVRKINIVAAHAKGLPSSTTSKNEDFTPVESEQEMFEELCKITTLESPMKEDSKSKNDLKRQLSKDDKIDEPTPNRRPRLSLMLNKIDYAMQDLKKSTERMLPVPQKGYSPPILPIATFEKTLEILAQANIELYDDGNFGPIRKKKIPVLRKRCLSFDERRDNAKKISIDEYKKRSTGKYDKAIDFVVQHQKDDQNGGHNPDQDLGYDSDTTMKL